jgi:predicted transcriptional regulator
MVGVITGDIINSRKYNANLWLPALKQILNKHGNEPETWEIFRGDSFQLEIKEPALTLNAAFQIKAAIKQVKGPDVRMAIGIGDKDYSAGKISENNGSAFVYSGEEFEKLKQSIAIKTPWQDFNNEINIYLSLALIIMDNWTPAAAKTMSAVLESQIPITQAEIGEKLGIKQSGASQRLSRAHYKEIIEFEKLFREKIRNLLLK